MLYRQLHFILTYKATGSLRNDRQNDSVSPTLAPLEASIVGAELCRGSRFGLITLTLVFYPRECVQNLVDVDERKFIKIRNLEGRK